MSRTRAAIAGVLVAGIVALLVVVWPRGPRVGEGPVERDARSDAGTPSPPSSVPPLERRPDVLAPVGRTSRSVAATGGARTDGAPPTRPIWRSNLRWRSVDEDGAPSEREVDATPAAGPDVARIAALFARGKAMPGFPSSAAGAFTGEWIDVERAPAKTTLAAFHQRVRIRSRLDGDLTLGAWSSVILEQGSGVPSRLRLEHHSTVVLRGDQEGEHEVTDHSTLVVEGDLRGSVTVHGHATVMVEGRMLGMVRVGDHGRALFLGGAPGRVVAAESVHPILVLRGAWSARDVARFGTPGPLGELHLEQFDDRDGERASIPDWATIIVGGDRWKELLR